MLTATHLNYYHLCHRKLWLFGSQIQMEYRSELVRLGKVLSESSYTQRALKNKELDFGFMKIDHYDAKNKVIREVKKSPKMEQAHEAQLKYYLWAFEKMGLKGVTGLLEYPESRKTKRVVLSAQNKKEIEEWSNKVNAVLKGDCPPRVSKPICKKCAYYDYCFI